jgi:PAP2 superfamily
MPFASIIRSGRRHFVLAELALWTCLYLAYLAVRGATIGDRHTAVAHATDVLRLERALDLAHEEALQHALGSALEAFSAYYMLGFGPIVFAVLVWLAARHRPLYRELRTVLLVSLGLAMIAYVAFPTAPPRLVPGLGIADPVGLSGGHDTGSFAGIRFNPYAAMPSMHVGWSLLVGLAGFRAARHRLARALFLIHPVLMAVTVTATGNHWFADSIAGAAAALAAVGGLALLRRLRPGRVETGARVLPFPVRSEEVPHARHAA